MVFTIERAEAVASMLEKFTTAHAYQVAGQFANLEFWVSETLSALKGIEDYGNRFERLAAGQRAWVDAHDVEVGSYCSHCGGKCEFEPQFQRPGPPVKVPANDRNAAISRLKDAFYFFVARCFRMHLLDEESFRQLCRRVDTSIDPRDLVRTP